MFNCKIIVNKCFFFDISQCTETANIAQSVDASSSSNSESGAEMSEWKKRKQQKPKSGTKWKKLKRNREK